MNFQESTTILNACTKKSGNLLNIPRTNQNQSTSKYNHSISLLLKNIYLLCNRRDFTQNFSLLLSLDSIFNEIILIFSFFIISYLHNDHFIMFSLHFFKYFSVKFNNLFLYWLVLIWVIFPLYVYENATEIPPIFWTVA